MKLPRASLQAAKIILEEPTVNLTPLIDVVFVILIMFILIAPLLQLDHVELAPGPKLSATQMTPVRDISPIAIHVHADNSLSFQGALIDLSALKQELVNARLAHPQAVPQLFHDQRGSFGTYQSVKNALEEAGFSDLDLVLQP